MLSYKEEDVYAGIAELYSREDKKDISVTDDDDIMEIALTIILSGILK